MPDTNDSEPSNPPEGLPQLSRSVAGLVVLVTGAGSGMGRATAGLFGVEGARVAVTDIDTDHAIEVAGVIRGAGGQAEAWTLDVRSTDNVDA
ncbi:MAG: SDR family NAD(P)-dependent oxidoreductase, partial [Microthrixaceae bacterium]